MIPTPVTIAPSSPPPLDPRRVVELQAYCCLIDAALGPAAGALPFGAARQLVARLAAAGVAALRRGEDVNAIQMLGVTARATGSDYALLANWKTAAMTRIEGGVA